MYTLDTNTLIYYASGDNGVTAFIDQALDNRITLLIPTIVVVEFLSYPVLKPPDEQFFYAILNQLTIIPLDLNKSYLAATLRRNWKIKLADSVIAATALTNGSTLITRNVKDFQKIPNLIIRKV